MVPWYGAILLISGVCVCVWGGGGGGGGGWGVGGLHVYVDTTHYNKWVLQLLQLQKDECQLDALYSFLQ